MRTVPAELVKRYEEAGYWTRDTLGDLLARGLAAAPGTTFAVHSDVRPWSGTFADVDDRARRLAGGLRQRGVGPGDVVAFQLPNWVEAAVTFWAAAYLGAVVVPIVHFYGRKEVSYILSAVRPKAFITAARFGRMEFQRDLVDGVPVVGVVDENFESLLAPAPMAGQVRVDPQSPALIAFTSGTTRDPKGVIHSHQTLGFETRQLADLYPKDRGHQLTSAPVGHFIGMLNAFLIPVLDGTPVNLSDVWDPARAMRLMDSHGLTIGGGAVIYLTSILDHPEFTKDRIRHMKYAGLGGAPVPVAVTSRLEDLGITVFRSYGSTEQPSITGCHHTEPREKRLATDGPVLPGVEIRLTADGEILSRGPDLCLGYTDEALTLRAFDDEGWYHTGDIGVLDDDGYLAITDRKSDIIIRGGENISAQEVEELLLGLDGVAEVAVVAAPDARLGEHAAAVLRMRPGYQPPALDDIRQHLSAAGLARQKWPEELHVADDFPRTASGKIQKFVLRKSLQEGTTMWETIPEMVLSTADRFGDAEAIVDGDLRLSFSELVFRVRCAAGAFAAAGIEKGDRVAIWAPNSAEWIIAAFGLLTAGGTLVPVNTRFKEAEAADIISRSGAKLVLVQKGFLGLDFSTGVSGVPVIDIKSGFLASGSPLDDAEARRRMPQAGDIADIIFTSGTTGRPKGVMMPHSATLRLYAEWNDLAGTREGDRYLIVNPFFHIFGYKAGVIASMIRGMTVYPFPVFDIDRVLDVVEKEQITVLPGAPTIYHELLAAQRRGGHDMSSLRVAVTGAADIPVDLIRRIREELPFQSIMTGYGLTEAGTITASRQGDSFEDIATTVGLPCEGFEMRIAPDGEVLARGYAVMKGYFDDPGATAEAIDADGWLHTGDLGVMDASGRLKIIGRKKDMFIVGGFNAYPAEIEGFLMQHPAVAQAAVIGVPDERMGQVGKAFVVLRPGASISADGLIVWAREKMAGFKVPRYVAFIDALPLNATGKVQKDLLK